MEILCTRPGCPRPQNFFPDLDEPARLKTAQQKYCTSCGMPLILAGRYLPSRLLGKGGFGAAFLACDRYTPAMRECVVKQFQPSGGLSQQQLAIAESLFEREAAVLEQIGHKHPQIPDLFAFFPLIVPSRQGGTEDQFFYLVQEYIEGEDLERELARKGSFSEAEVREVLIAVLNILKFVHENGTIHRDIKPSNIMRHQDGKLYLLDFGAVKQVTASAGASPGRSTGIYSMGFAPPEQMQGSQVYPATDLYALAATCLNLLTGKNVEELYDSYNNGWNWKPYAPQISQELSEIFDRMLQGTPKQRFQSAQEVLEALNPTQSQASAKVTSPQPSLQNLSTPAVSAPPPTSSPPPPAPAKSRFSLLEIMGNAGFIGFEGALLLIALTSLIAAPPISVGLWGMTLGGLIYALYRRLIEKVDLVIIAGITLGLVLLIPPLRDAIALTVFSVVLIAFLAGAGAIAITALFRLIYLLIARFL